MEAGQIVRDAFQKIVWIASMRLNVNSVQRGLFWLQMVQNASFALRLLGIVHPAGIQLIARFAQKARSQSLIIQPAMTKLKILLLLSTSSSGEQQWL